MRVNPSQLSWKEGKIWYTSRDFQVLQKMEWPSADSVSLASCGKWGQDWEWSSDAEPNRVKVVNVLDVDEMLADVLACTEQYPDMGLFQDLIYGGNANLHIPFESLRLDNNYKMDVKGEAKLEKKLAEEVRKDFITPLLQWDNCQVQFPRLRVHPMGLIPKSRSDRELRKNGRLEEVTWRTISDMKKILKDGTSINSCSGSFGSLKLPQGERLLRLIDEAQQRCKKRGLDPRDIVMVKWDVKSAYRNFRIAPADRWAFGFTFKGKFGLHKSWPFGNIASVYNFLRFPLLVVWYLSQSDQFKLSTAVAAMYFDDLMVLAHKNDMFPAAQLVESKFQDWKIPRQEKKFKEENPNGMYGASRGNILGHTYDFKEETISIPTERLVEIMEEMKRFMANKDPKGLKEWESTTGLLAWVKVVIPQIGPAMSSTYNMIRAIKVNNRGEKRRLGAKIRLDWDIVLDKLRRWNGKMSFIRSKWPEEPNKEVFGVEPELYVEPSADASGRIGWGGVCELGYVKGIWTEEEKELKIHIKEGLALWAVIRTFGKDLKGRKMKLKQLSMRSDNQVLISGLRKGRSKFEDMNIVIQMIFDALIELQVSLATWRVKAWSQAKVLFIGTKENVMSDALSRDDLLTFHNYVDNNKLTVFPKLIKQQELKEADMKVWKKKVKEILEISRSLKEQN